VQEKGGIAVQQGEWYAAKKKGPVRVFDLRVRFGKVWYEWRSIVMEFWWNWERGGRWEIRIKRSDSLSSPFSSTQPRAGESSHRARLSSTIWGWSGTTRVQLISPGPSENGVSANCPRNLTIKSLQAAIQLGTVAFDESSVQ